MNDRTEGAGNNLNDPALMAHLLKCQREFDDECDKTAAAKKAADKARKAWRKNVSGAYGFALGNFDVVFQQFMDEDFAAREIENLREQRRLAELAGLPLFASIKLPGDKASLSKQPGPFEHGARAHLNGKSEGENPHDMNTAAGQEWSKGFRMSEARCKEGSEKAAKLAEEAAAKPPKSRGRPKKNKDEAPKTPEGEPIQ